MTRHSRRTLLAAVGRAAAGVGLAGGVAGAAGDRSDAAETGTSSEATDRTAQGETDETASIRFVNASPETRRLAVVVDGETLIDGLLYARVGRFRALPAGRHRLLLRAARREKTLFEGAVTIRGGEHTAVAAPARDGGARPLGLLRFTDRPVPIGDDEALVRLVHASPDAPAVDVTAAGNGRLLFDDLGYGETQVATLPAGERTLQIRPATRFNIGPVVRSVGVSIEGGRRYTAFAVGYLTPIDEPTDAPVRVLVTSGVE